MERTDDVVDDLRTVQGQQAHSSEPFQGKKEERKITNTTSKAGA